MAEETQIQEPTEATPDAAQPVAPDPFAIDENAFVSLSPEQRASVEPIIDTWKKRAMEEISKRESSASEKYKPLEEKATALDRLTSYAPFVQWWQSQQQQAMQAAQPAAQGAIQGSQPQQFASQQEWQEAIWEAGQGQPEKLQTIQARMMQAWAAPIIQEQQVMKTQGEVQSLFDRHPDAKELDRIGLDDKGQGVSLLEMGLDWAERNRRPLEEGYALAAKWRDQMTLGAKQQAMGIVTSKKSEVTAGPSTSHSAANVVEVGSADELIKRTMDAQLNGDTKTKFVINPNRK